jgi:hypothetical protein
MHVFPAEIRQLANTQAMTVSEQDYCRVAVWVAAGLFDRPTQVLDLRFGQKPRGFSPLSRRLRIPRGLAGLCRLGQGQDVGQARHRRRSTVRLRMVPLLDDIPQRLVVPPSMLGMLMVAEM